MKQISVVLINLFVIVNFAVTGQNLNQDDKQVKRNPENDTTFSGYIDATIIGGPGDISEQMVEDNTNIEEPVIESEKTWLERWYHLKKTILDKSGFQFTARYGFNVMYATRSKGAYWAAGGIFQFDLEWVLLNRKLKNKGSLGLRVETRHPVFTAFTPNQMGQEIGSLWRPDIPFGRVRFNLTQIWWEQQFWKGKAGMRIGKTVNPAFIYDYFSFRNPNWGLESEPTFLSAVPWPANPLGVVFAVFPIDELYFMAGIHDANGSFTEFGFETVFNGEYFYVLEAGYTSPGDMWKTNNIHVTFWARNAVKEKEQGSGWGLVFSFQRKLGKYFIPFARFTYSYGGITPMKNLFSTGTGINVRKNDLFIISFYFGVPDNKELRDQQGIEVNYKFFLLQNFYMTPTVQILFNPSQNDPAKAIGVFSLRSVISF